MTHIYGKIIYISKNYIIIDCNGIGYKLFIIENEIYNLNEFKKVYIYKSIKIDNRNIIEDFFCFTDNIKRNIFSDFISISGIGPVTTKQMLSNDYKLIIDFIINQDINSLKLLNGFNEKNSISIISNLSLKYKNIYSKNVFSNNLDNNASDLISALQQLGYKDNDINYALSKCDMNKDLHEMIGSSIRLIAKEYEQV